MPLAEIKTAGVIIAVSTATDAVKASMGSCHFNDCGLMWLIWRVDLEHRRVAGLPVSRLVLIGARASLPAKLAKQAQSFALCAHAGRDARAPLRRPNKVWA